MVMFALMGYVFSWGIRQLRQYISNMPVGHFRSFFTGAMLFTFLCGFLAMLFLMFYR
jgi:hypothetical protein